MLWDYDEKTLKKTKKGRVLILERKINYGPGKNKINRKQVKKDWNSLSLFTLPKRLMELLIWGKYRS